MTKKRSSNGFMYFADARRAVYEAENDGIHLTAKKLVERAARDWKLMNEDERQKWRSESRRRHDEVFIFYLLSIIQLACVKTKQSYRI